MTALSPEDQAIVDEELALLQRAREAVARAPRPASVADDQAAARALRELRDEVVTARVEDLGPLLHDLGVRQRLRRRSQEQALPDPEQPYFAHLKVQEGGQARDYLLGAASLLDGGVRIVDWRLAPVAQIFYRHREGDAYEEEFPGRTAEGTVLARRIVVLAGERLERIVGDDRVLERDAAGRWRRADAVGLAEGGAGTAFRPGELGVGAGASRGRAPVTALLDPEQFAAVQAPPGRALLVLGSAGSGKTTVALHRLDALAARWPGRFAPARTLVVVPSEGLARLTRRLLAPLGIGEPRVQTLDEWALGLARRVFGEALPRVSHEAPALVIALKRHPALHDALRARLGPLAPAQATWPRLRRRLADAFSDRAFLERVVADAAPTLPATCVEETIRHTMRQLADDPARALRHVVDRERRRAIDGRDLDDGTPEAIAGSIDVEDLPIALSLRASASPLPVDPIEHLVLDEAEDFSLFELDVLGRQLAPDPTVTVAGDEAQQTTSSFPGWGRVLGALGLGEAERCRLGVSYRCPRPIVELARHVLGPLASPEPPRAARDGAPVSVVPFAHEAQGALFLVGLLGDLGRREPRASVGVLCRDAAAAQALHRSLGPHLGARLVTGGAFSFEPGVDVADLDSAKGLEFDYVVVPDATAPAYPAREEARRALHVAVTRASHQLALLTPGAPSPLLLGAPARAPSPP